MNCKHWSECNVPGGGCCDLGLYGGTPSIGICTNKCQQMESDAPSPTSSPELTIFGKAISYVRAELSGVISKTPDEKYAARIDACMSCPQFQKAEEDGKIGWCKACGCSQNSRAELSVKARMPAARCPLKKWDGTTSKNG